jgi:hypothetical protein
MLIEILAAEQLEPEYVDGRPGDVMRHQADTAKASKSLLPMPNVRA